MKAAAEEEDTSQCEGYGDSGGAYTTAAKDQHTELLHRSQKGSGLHDQLSRHHRPNGKCIQVPVGDISQVEGREGRLG